MDKELVHLTIPISDMDQVNYEILVNGRTVFTRLLYRGLECPKNSGPYATQKLQKSSHGDAFYVMLQDLFRVL